MKARGKKRAKKEKKNRKNLQGKSKAKKAFLYALGISAAGGAAYLMWDHIKKKRHLIQQQLPEGTTDTIIINNNLPATTVRSLINPVASKGRTDNFPLKQGSSGTRVTQLQQALSDIIGAEAMRANGGIDGKFGPGTANALRMAGFGAVIDEATFSKIVGGSSLTIVFNPKEIATTLFRFAQAKNLEGCLATLKRIKSPAEYSQVNEFYKDIPIISKTIVTDLLEFAFSGNESAKQQIRNEFLRIGLKMDTSGRWSLQGFQLYKDIITLKETFVIDSRQNRIPVRKNTILGDEVANTNGMTWFRSLDNSIMQVPTQDVKYT